MTTFVGSSNNNQVISMDGTGNTAVFVNPKGIATGRVGNLYVADTGNHTIRKITPTGVVSTLAGLAGNTGTADGTGATARFNSPREKADWARNATSPE